MHKHAVLPVVLAASMMLSSVPAVSAYADTLPGGGYSDVDERAWYHDVVLEATEAGIMSGYGGTTEFGPTRQLLRAEMACILTNADGANPSGYKDATGLPDVSEPTWYTGAVNYAYQNGYIKGYDLPGQDLFGPLDGVTREQAIVMLYRWAEAKGADTKLYNNLGESYPDWDEVSDWAKDAIEWALERNIMDGAALSIGDYLEPGRILQRAEAAKVMLGTMDVRDNGKNNIDTNGDGKPDLNIDTDGDGVPDVNIDSNGDGIPDLNVDEDGDGIPDFNEDENEDGNPDDDGSGLGDVTDVSPAIAMPNTAWVGAVVNISSNFESQGLTHVKWMILQNGVDVTYRLGADLNGADGGTVRFDEDGMFTVVAEGTDKDGNKVRTEKTIMLKYLDGVGPVVTNSGYVDMPVSVKSDVVGTGIRNVEWSIKSNGQVLTNWAASGITGSLSGFNGGSVTFANPGYYTIIATSYFEDGRVTSSESTVQIRNPLYLDIDITNADAISGGYNAELDFTNQLDPMVVSTGSWNAVALNVTEGEFYEAPSYMAYRVISWNLMKKDSSGEYTSVSNDAANANLTNDGGELLVSRPGEYKLQAILEDENGVIFDGMSNAFEVKFGLSVNGADGNITRITKNLGESFNISVEPGLFSTPNVTWDIYKKGSTAKLDWEECVNGTLDTSGGTISINDTAGIGTYVIRATSYDDEGRVVYNEIEIDIVNYAPTIVDESRVTLSISTAFDDIENPFTDEATAKGTVNIDSKAFTDTFSGDVLTLGYEYKIDASGQIKPLTGRTSDIRLPNGEHTLYVRAVDQWGAESPWVEVDATIAPVLDAGEVTVDIAGTYVNSHVQVISDLPYFAACVDYNDPERATGHGVSGVVQPSQKASMSQTRDWKQGMNFMVVQVVDAMGNKDYSTLDFAVGSDGMQYAEPIIHDYDDYSTATITTEVMGPGLVIDQFSVDFNKVLLHGGSDSVTVYGRNPSGTWEKVLVGNTANGASISYDGSSSNYKMNYITDAVTEIPATEFASRNYSQLKFEYRLECLDIDHTACIRDMVDVGNYSYDLNFVFDTDDYTVEKQLAQMFGWVVPPSN